MAYQDPFSQLVEWGSGVFSTIALFFGGRSYMIHDRIDDRIATIERTMATKVQVDADLHDLRIDLNRREDKMDERFRELKDDLKEDIRQVLKGLEELNKRDR